MTGFTFEHFWAAVMTLVSALLGLLHLGHRREMDGMRKSAETASKAAAETAKGLADHKLYAAETYARRDSMEKVIERIEDRIDQRFDELREEIRALKH